MEIDNNEHNATYTLTSDEFLKIGLKCVSNRRHRIHIAKRRMSVDCFLEHFGSIPCICASTWEDLQMTELKEAWVPAEDSNVEYFLMGMCIA
jgi:hypothetical protein